MPSNDERRQVAARLRDYATRDFEESNPWWYLSKAITGSFAAYDDVGEYFTDLADLIEPEPPRTCRVERMEIDEFGRYFYLSCGHMQMTHNNSALPYCPICGAKVIEQRKEARCQTEMTGS